MRRKQGYLVIGVLTIVAISLVGSVIHKKAKAKENKVVRVGVCAYKATDTFVGSIINELEKIMKEEEQKRGISIKFDVADAKEEQALQNTQVERYIALDYDIICINIVDRTSAATLIDKASSAGIPIVFFNRQPVEEDMYRSNDIYYVGSNPKQSAIIQGELIQEFYERYPEQIDSNKNNKIEYGILEGETGHPDTVIRTEYAITTLEKSGIALQKVAGWSANFDRSQACAVVEQWLGTSDDAIEMIIANNDDMALGAADAIEKLGKKGIKVVGIDGTPQGRSAVDEGVLLGTVVSNQELYAKKIFSICEALILEDKDMSSLGLENNKYYWMPWEKYMKADN